MLSLIKILLFTFIAMPCSLYALDKNGNFESKGEQDRYIAATLKKMTVEINSQAPIMIDAETQMSYVLSLNKTINFTMKLVNVSSKEVNAKEINKYAWDNVNDIACKNQATRYLIDLGVSYVYIYFGNDDRLITRVVLDKYICKK